MLRLLLKDLNNLFLFVISVDGDALCGCTYIFMVQIVFCFLFLQISEGYFDLGKETFSRIRFGSFPILRSPA